MAYTFNEIMDFAPANRQVYREIKTNLNNLIPFVGAGLTAFAYYGSWKNALLDIAQFAPKQDQLGANPAGIKSREEIIALLNDNTVADNLLKAAQQIEDSITKSNMAGAIKSVFSPNKLNANTDKLPTAAISLLPHLFKDRLVVTTNFDQVLEYVYERERLSFEGVYHPGHYSELNAATRGAVRVLFKLHGSMFGEHINYSDLVFTEKQYDKHYAPDSELVKTLKTCFNRRQMLFLGCSLDADRTMQVLDSVLSSAPDNDNIYNYTIINCKKDELGAKTIALGARHIRAIFYEGDRHEAVRVILEKLLEDTDNTAYKSLPKHVGAQKQQAANPFLYYADSVDFIGRDDEMQALRLFMDSGETVSWWGIVGPGGSGKSRLAYEMQKEYEKKGWSVKLLRRNDYKDLFALEQSYTNNTLFIVDYVQQYAGKVGEWLNVLTDSSFSRSCKLRVLLLERDNNYDGAQYQWEKQLYQCADYLRLKSARFKSAFLKLEPLSDDKLKEIIRSFFNWLKNNSENIRGTLSDEGEEILRALKSVDEQLVRPLYALFLTDAYAASDDPNFSAEMDREKVLNYVTVGELTRLQNNIHALGTSLDEKLLSEAQLLWYIATVLGDVELDELAALCPTLWRVIENKAEQYNLSSSESLLSRLGLLEGESIPAMRPDIMGEYFVLNWLLQAGRSSEKAALVSRFFSAALNRQTVIANYFRMACSDYKNLINESPDNWTRLLPELELETDGQKLFYANLIACLYEFCFFSKQRERLITLLDKNSIELSESSAEVAAAYNNIGYAYLAKGDPDTALKWYNKALNVRLAVYGENHPDTATSYSNIGGAYFKKGDPDTALKWYNKALKVFEAVHGKNHPYTATSYNNIGSAYDDKGDHDTALEWYNKALNVKLAVYGENHPFTATSYNNIGLAYDNKGDPDTALKWYKKAMAVDEKVLGKEHPSTATDYNNIGGAHLEKGISAQPFNKAEIQEALKWVEKALAVREKTLGSGHPDTENTRLGVELCKQLLNSLR